MKEPSILVIIPARGGSKGIPRKNLRPLNGKPLIYYAIQNALQQELPGLDCYVSSEDEEILLMAVKFGAKTIKREPNIAGDMVTLDPVIHHAYEKIKELEKKDYDLVITLQPTSPLLKKESLERAISLVLEDKADTLISGTYDSHLTWLKKDDKFVPNYEERLNRQELPEIYKETGGFVITKSQYVTPNSRFGKRIEIFPLSKRESIDIDDFEDWSLCEFYLKRKLILFVVSGNSEIGMGHVYNTLSIANEILNHTLVFLVDRESKLAYDKISESNYRVYMQEDKTLTEEILAINPDIIIHDCLDTEAEYMKALSQRSYCLINFEDLGEGTKFADLVINAMYPEGRIMAGHHFGAKYFILRDEFLFTPSKKIEDSVSNILISFGGVDPNDYTRRILKILSSMRQEHDFQISVITGMGYKDPEKLSGEFPFIRLMTNIASMSDEILKADIVFTSAGRTTFEVASIGTPAIVLCQNKRETTHFFASEKNGFYNLGLGFEIEDKIIEEAFLECMTLENRQTMNQRMLDNDLKRGKQRVINLIHKTIQQD